jgi:hypothetical protein
MIFENALHLILLCPWIDRHQIWIHFKVVICPQNPTIKWPLNKHGDHYQRRVILDQKGAQVHPCLTAQTFQSEDTEENISSESRNINQGIWMSLVKQIFHHKLDMARRKLLKIDFFKFSYTPLLQRSIICVSQNIQWIVQSFTMKLYNYTKNIHLHPQS